ncbi:MAG: thiamine diphosphokinase [Acutalibacteraceae bacterium]
MKTCYIFGALPINETNIDIDGNDIIIAADAGLNTVNSFNLTPDYTVGDFDSLGVEPTGDNVFVYPKEKDDTDALIAVKLGFQKGFRHFKIYGCIGGRTDHTIANIQLASYIAEKGGCALFYDDNSIITVIKNTSVTFTESARGTISVFAVSDKAKGVTISNLKYNIENAVLSPDLPLGVSNEFIEKPSEIKVNNGKLCIVFNKNNEKSFKINE